MTKRIDFNTIFEVTDSEGTIHLLINTKYTVIFAELVYPIWNTPHSMRLLLCETIVIDYQYQTEAATYH